MEFDTTGRMHNPDAAVGETKRSLIETDILTTEKTRGEFLKPSYLYVVRKFYVKR